MHDERLTHKKKYIFKIQSIFVSISLSNEHKKWEKEIKQKTALIDICVFNIDKRRSPE